VDSNKKKKKSSGGIDLGAWQVVYTGFVLILLCFFIMLCSFSKMETSKVTRFVRSFSNAVSIFEGGLKFDKGEIVLPVSSDIVSAESEIANIFSEISEVMKMYGVDKEVGELVHFNGGLMIRLSDSILFDSGSATINPSAINILSKIGNILTKTPYSIRIEGHTDNVPIKTTEFPSNWELSTTRAINVLRYFFENKHNPS
jgi:chemotaxis protein MotB